MSGTPTKSKNTSREPKAPPYVDCIQWVPRRFAGGPSPVTLADLVFTQHALKAVREHAGSQQAAAVFGLLIGKVHEDPTCARPWVSVEHVLRGTTLPANHTLLQLDHAYEALLDAVDEAHGIVVGWYCSHPGAGLYLSPDEARFHESRFSSPWEMALVVVGDAGRFTGGVFQRTNPEGLSRSIYTPFYELVDGSSEFNGNTKRTFVGWPNYQTETRVVMAGRGSVSAHIPLAGGDPYADSATTPEAEVGVRAADKEAELPYLANVPKRRHPPAAAPQPTKKRAAAPSDDAKRPAASTTPPKKDDRPSREPTTGTAPMARPETPSGRPAAGKGLDPVPAARPTGSGDIEADWEKKQIQRSLMAVGRSIGPSAMGDLARPVEVGADDDDGVDGRPPKASRPKPGTPEPPEPVEEPRRHAPAPPVRRPSPVSPASTLSADPGMVGRSRRKSGLPVGKILAAAAGLALLAGAGWVGTQALRGPSGAVAQEDATGRPTAEAGVSLAPRDLFSEDRTATPDTADEGPDSLGTLEASSERLVALGPDPIDDPVATDDGVTGGDDAQATSAGAEEQQPEARTAPPRQQTPVEQNPPPAPGEIQLDLEDPDISAYENALRIFRAEADRYDTEREAFDNGGGSCNALNLALRGVRESFGRLERRYNTAAEKFAGPQLRAFEGAGRQNAMISTHYSLTDCPASGR